MALRAIVGILWLVAAFVFRGNPTGRRILAFFGSIVGFVHVGAVAGGLLLKLMTGRTSVEGGVNMAGFLAGCIVGLILGVVAGSFVSRNEIAYWLVQLIAVAFVVFLPLFRW